MSTTTANADADDSAPPRAVDIRRDIPALLLVALTALTLVSVLTHDPADPVPTPFWPLNQFFTPDLAVYPANDVVQNACGSLGALISSMLLSAVGIGSSLVISAGGGIATALLIRGHMNAPVLRSLGGCITLLAVTTAAAMTDIELNGMPVVGNGGYLGAMTSTFLLQHFHPVGSWILTLTVLSVGLLLTTDYMLVYAGRTVLFGGAKVSRRGFAKAAKAMPVTLRRRRQPFSDLDGPILIDGDESDASLDPNGGRIDPPEPAESGPTIKLRNPKEREAAAEDETEEAEEATPANGLAKVAKLGAAGLAAAAGIGTSLKKSKEAPEELEEEYEYEEWEEEEEEAPTRDLEVEGEPTTLRNDSAHDESPSPTIKMPKKKDAKQELYDSVQEGAPEGISQYHLPSLELLEGSDGFDYEEQHAEALQKSAMLQQTIRSFGFNVTVTNVEIGPVIAQYELELERGLRLNKITALADDLAIALRVPSVRVVAPIPGKNTVGIEVPNEIRQVVRLRDVIEESDSRISKMNIPVFLGKDVSGEPMPVDLAKMPHLLIAGRTGTGKSVCLNAIITSILMCCRPDEVRLLMIDPKMVELSGYGRLPHLMHPVITDMKKAEAILGWAVEKMEERYSLLAKAGVRHINSFNDLGRDEVLRRLEVDEDDENTDVPDKLPFIVIIADEMADLMMTAGKDVEQHIIRLAQKSRAVGIHLILATQKPTVDVITGLIKSNLPARLSFQVASKTDSRVVLDENGADKLLGNGDMLFLWPGTSTLIRGQGTYLSDAEIDRVCDHCSSGGEQQFVGELMNLKINDEEGDASEMDVDKLRKRDELYESAIEVVIREGRGSLSLIQRCLGIGYGRAARLVDYMAEDGIVGQYNGSKSREVLLTMEQWNAMQGITDDSGGTTATPKASSQTEAEEEYEDEEEEEEYYDEEEYEDDDYEDV
ncbi:MAG TPA: DNA translocase FtsK [Rhodopirellula baltica]|uniref:Stage III sporulation protein E n=1 Tax=Rhodopirellula baltica (strain DSM 10527 / NCIMB 13988 / SH1) TaxID=243090 RepID=Q7UJL4_RHOBA|nr:DNA translocase FtsK [Rhodopirellula baltica]CAD77244.1 stage III sporulation protein E [Rhodopirellula baltica SH 1]HBE62861.1 DNA translocase FtsK [Rhodopirellula baltica]